MNTEKYQSVLKDIQFKPDWIFNVIEKNGAHFLQVEFDAEDSQNPDAYYRAKGRKWYLSPHMTRSEIVLTAFKAVMTAMEHEVRETFRYKGRAILGPHISVDELHSIADKLETRE